MPTTIYLIRHGICPPTKEPIFRSRVDFSLSEEGQRQSSLLAKELRNVDFCALYSSPLARALETAGAICAARRLEPLASEAFNAMDHGEWDGRLCSEIAERYPREYKAFLDMLDDLRIPGGETLADVQARALTEVSILNERHEGKTYAIITHNTVIRVLLASFLDMRPPYSGKLDPMYTSITVVEHTKDHGHKLLSYNQTSHLE